MTSTFGSRSAQAANSSYTVLISAALYLVFKSMFFIENSSFSVKNVEVIAMIWKRALVHRVRQQLLWRKLIHNILLQGQLKEGKRISFSIVFYFEIMTELKKSADYISRSTFDCIPNGNFPFRLSNITRSAEELNGTVRARPWPENFHKLLHCRKKDFVEYYIRNIPILMELIGHLLKLST